MEAVMDTVEDHLMVDVGVTTAVTVLETVVTTKLTFVERNLPVIT